MLTKAAIFLRPFFAALAFIFMGVLLFRQWHVLQAYPWHIRPPWLLASALMLVASWLVEVRLWQQALEIVGGRLDYRSAIRIWFPAAVSRFIPGSVWQPMSMVVLSRDRNVSPDVTVASMMLFHAMQLVVVGTISGAYVLLWGRGGADAQTLAAMAQWLAILIVPPGALLLIYPRPILAAGNWLLARVRRRPFALRLSSADLVKLLGLSLTTWLLVCTAFVTLARALTQESASALARAGPHLAAAYPVAYAVGFLTIVTPSGLAVREGVLLATLAPVVGDADATVIAIGMRIWEVGLEGIVTAGLLAAPLVAARRARFPGRTRTGAGNPGPDSDSCSRSDPPAAR